MSEPDGDAELTVDDVLGRLVEAVSERFDMPEAQVVEMIALWASNQ